ncbi:hypothetical protein CR203_16120 [Salipaludibacillus neizhouensis]|uniref:Polysaccharide chain length determinant N-terminal domain-containing protein n=1 Tax=Salipaludibacillus neizhouensis TaxID=885475 RepID=A0A3A9KNY0_9BACI|nr:Wzz/FepE/Etk N-terminal domain-containing protein [Salipaludibacillus neizhouensis]RKL66416.1 hypothetical protein CR203_16120 [Salipaludibacillus neizhouensis]
MNGSSEKEIQIKPILMALVTRWWIIILMTGVIGGLGTYYQHENVAAPIYSATASILVQEESVNMHTLKTFITEPIVLDEVAKDPSIEASAEQLGSLILVSDVEGSEIIKIDATGSSPENAVLVANTVGTVFSEVVRERLGYTEISMLSEATVQDSLYPINETTNTLSFASFILGAVLAVGFALLLDSIDNRIKTERQIESMMEVPVLGSVSRIQRLTLRSNPARKKKTSLRGETSV